MVLENANKHGLNSPREKNRKDRLIKLIVIPQGQPSITADTNKKTVHFEYYIYTSVFSFP